MRSIKEIFVIGNGPSSSHTMGPAKACEYILKTYPNAKSVQCTLYGSLASTGKGHLTDYIIGLKLKPVKHKVIFDFKTKTKHPNTMIFTTVDANGEKHVDHIVSIGGGTIVINKEKDIGKDVYPEHYLTDILKITKAENISLVDYVLKHEDPDILDYIRNVMKVMEDAFKRGIHTEGELPGPLHISRKAPEMFRRFQELSNLENWKDYNLMMAIGAFATAEENACGGVICTAPTCGSAGVIPGALAYLFVRGTPREDIEKGMLVAGLIGMLCKTNGSVSGAEAGCQAEIGVACAMAAAMIATAKGYINSKIAQAAEIALEHSLGLTCDPVKGYVQIPCIERCAMYAMKARSAAALARLIPHRANLVSFDDSVATMFQTGKDMNAGYRETSKDGLSKQLKKRGYKNVGSR